ncbi:MAG TPA: histidinol-phosphate transaminase [Verrucomicrobiae bacterium]|nr:histidinol-phosphate transaminase [Verrucomicrobiae bacterium]
MNYIRRNIQRMAGYVPGEQPRSATGDLIKLNTNENPYPPSPKVLEVLRAAIDGTLRLYPDPAANALRQKLAKQYGFEADQIIVGNGCDDILNLCVRAFCGECEKLAYFWPSYSLYPALANIQGAAPVELPLNEDFQIQGHPPLLAKLAGVKLVFITQPNAPSGVWLQKVALQRVIEEADGVVVIDEAYVDFASDNCLDFAREYDNVIVARSFSKSFSFAGMRVGWAAGPPNLIDALGKVKDSYNVSRLSQVGAEATLDDWDYYQQNVKKICATRERTTAALVKLGSFVYPSQTNFVFARPPAPTTAKQWFAALRKRNILVRWWDADRIRDFARVSIGTDAEMEKLVDQTRVILSDAKPGEAARRSAANLPPKRDPSTSSG